MRMTFEKGRAIVKFSLLATVVCCILSLLTQTNGSVVATYLAYAAIVFLVLTVFFALTALKCPYCGKLIFRKCLVVKDCPHCGRNLSTGLKDKKKKKR